MLSGGGSVERFDEDVGQLAPMSAELLPSKANGLGIASALDVEDALLDLVGSLGCAADCLVQVQQVNYDQPKNISTLPIKSSDL